VLDFKKTCYRDN